MLLLQGNYYRDILAEKTAVTIHAQEMVSFKTRSWSWIKQPSCNLSIYWTALTMMNLLSLIGNRCLMKFTLGHTYVRDGWASQWNTSVKVVPCFAQVWEYTITSSKYIFYCGISPSTWWIMHPNATWAFFMLNAITVYCKNWSRFTNAEMSEALGVSRTCQYPFSRSHL